MAYERERHPITEQVSHFAMNHAHAMAQRRRAIPADIEDDTPQAQATRQAFGRDLYELNVQQYCCAGLNFGYYYADSPLIAYDGEAAPAYSMGHFTASTVPGCRTPHFWLDDGRSLYDAFGPGYTVLCLRAGCEASVAALQAAAAARRMPLSVLDLSAQKPPAEYRHALLVARADAHTAWRGDALDAAGAATLVQRLCGAG